MRADIYLNSKAKTNEDCGECGTGTIGDIKSSSRVVPFKVSGAHCSESYGKVIIRRLYYELVLQVCTKWTA